MAGGALRELFGLFTIGVDNEQLKAADRQIDQFAKKVESIGKTIAGAFAVSAIGKFVEAQVQLGVETKYTAERLGVTGEMLQRFHYAAGLVGESASAADMALQRFNVAVGKGEEGSRMTSRALAALGVTIKDVHGATKPTEQLLSEAADGFSHVTDDARAAALAQELFGRSGTRMLPLLRKGSAGLEDLREEFAELGGGMNKDFLDRADKANHALLKLRTGFGSLKSRIVSEVLPGLTRLANGFSRGLSGFLKYAEHTYGIRTALMALGGSAVVLGLVKLWSVLGLGRTSVLGLLRSFAGFAIPIAIIGALYLIFDDLFTLISGGDSYIGRLLDQLGGIGTKQQFVDGLKSAFDSLREAGAAVWTAISAIGSALGTAFTAALPIVIGAAVVALEALAVTLTGIVDSLAAAFHYGKAIAAAAGGDIDGADAEMKAGDTKFRHLGETAAKVFGMQDDGGYAKWAAEHNSQAGQTAQYNAMGFSGPVAPSPSLRGGGNTTTVHDNSRPSVTNHITVSGAKDPKATGVAVVKAITTSSENRNHQQAADALNGGDD